MQYTVNVSQKGTYTLKINAAADNAGGRITIIIDGKVVAKNIVVPNTGDNKKFVTFEVKNIALKAGKQKIKILTAVGGYNFGYIQFVK